MRKIVFASAAMSLLFGAMPVLAQDNGAQCPEGQFRCGSMNNACATGPQCDAADKAGGKQMISPQNGDPNMGGEQGFRGDPNQNRDQRGMPNENQRPEDTRWFGQPGMNEEQFNQQNEDRQKQDDARMERDQKQQDERMKKDEERQKKDQERNVKRMQSDVKRFSGEVKRMKSDITRQEKTLKKCGIGLPADVTAAIAETDSLLTKAAASKDFEEIQNAQMELQEKMQVVRESQQSFGYLQGFCRMLPEGDKMLKRAAKEFNRVAKAASRNKDLDLSELKADYETELSKVKGVLDQVKQKMTTEPEEAMEMMQNDFFAGFEDVFNAIGLIDALANSSKGVKSLESQLKRVKKNLASLTKKGKDTSELSGAVSEFESAINDLKALRKQKKFDPEDMMGAFEDAFGALEEVGNALEELGVRNPDYAKNFSMPKNGPQFNVPQFKGLPQRQQGPGGPGMGPQDMGPGGFPGGPSMGPQGPGGFPGGDQGFGPQGPGGFPGGPGFGAGQEMMGPPPGDFEGGEFGPEAKKKAATQVAKR